MHMRWIIFTSIAAFLFASGANAGGEVVKCIRHDSAFPSAVSNATMFANCEIKLLPAGQKLCAQAHKDCTGVTENDFTDLAVSDGMQPQEVAATGNAAVREARDICDASDIPTPMYLYPYEPSNGKPMRWGTGFVCVLRVGVSRLRLDGWASERRCNHHEYRSLPHRR